MPKSQNGWEANDVTLTDVQTIPGTQRKIRLRKGAAGFLLRRVAAFIDREVENIDEPTQDDWGYAERPIRGSSTKLSNHASGTAIDVNATKHPLGATGTWSAAQKKKIHGHLNEYDGVIRWGEDYTKRKDGMHFEIVADAAAVQAVYDQLKNKPGTGTTPAPPKEEEPTVQEIEQLTKKVDDNADLAGKRWKQTQDALKAHSDREDGRYAELHTIHEKVDQLTSIVQNLASRLDQPAAGNVPPGGGQ